VAWELIGYLSDALGRGWEPPAEQIEALIADVPPAARGQAEILRTRLRDSAGRRGARLAEYEPLLAGGDTSRGRAVFFGNKVACATCHRVGSEGGQVGPDLTKVGSVRAGRDILESVVLPSSTFAQGYDSYVVQTNSGEVYAGIIPQPGADVIEVRDSAGKTTRLHKDQVKRVQRQPVSIMPEGLPAALTKEEFRDLLAYLQSLK
jgi:putative heme-binding domain-containing protein